MSLILEHYLGANKAMQIGVLKEQFDTRVAATAETVKKLVSNKHKVIVENNAGLASNILNQDYEQAGAVLADREEIFNSEILLVVKAPSGEVLASIKENTIVIGMLNPFDDSIINLLNARKVTAFSLEAAPRTSRAQSLDVLSSQANIAGYKAVMLAANEYNHFMPMLMTAAGTVKAARVLILGAGVAGLQAIATAKRLGAIVEASDVRPAAKEQIESLGAKFVDVPFETDLEMEIAQGVGGYARPMPESWMQRQQQAVHERVKQADIIITTALIPGRKAPILLHEESVKAMKSGSVVVDLAVSQGGNCPLTEADKVVVKHGVKFIGYTNLAGMVAADASSLYARNLLDFIKLIIDKEGNFILNMEDDIVNGCLMCTGGEIKRINNKA